MKITNGNSGHLASSHFGFHSTAHQSPQKLSQRPPLQHQLSPLQKLQAEYREKLQHEKEEKMSLLYQKWREESLRNIARKSSKDVKRHFKVDDSDKYSDRLPQKLAQPTAERKGNYRINSAHNPHEQRRPGQLPPIYQNNEIVKSKSFYNRSYRNERNDLHGRDGRTFRPPPPHQQASGSSNVDYQMKDAGDSPPDSRQLRQLCQRKLQQRKNKMLGELKEQEFANTYNGGNRENQRELSDFEQWQLEQDAAKTARLKKFNEQQHQLKMNGHGSSSRDTPTREINLGLKVDYCGKKQHKLMAANKIRENIQKQSRNVNGGPNLKRNQMSSSPTITQNRKDSPKRQEALRQKLKEKEINKLQEELRRKQEELRRMQFNRESSASFSGSDYDSDHDRSHVQKVDEANGAKRRFESGHKEISVSLFSDDEEDSASVGFQMKPVLVRRNGSGNSSKGNMPPTTNTNSNYSPAVKNNDKRVKKQTTSVTSDDLPLPTSINKRSLNYPVNVSSNTNGQIVTEDGETLELVPCKTCGRKFREDRLSKHAKICLKNVKKRKVYDMSKARTKGTDFEKFVRDNKVMRKPTPPPKPSNWREKHKDFIQTIQNAKVLQAHLARGGKVSDLPPPPPNENSDYIRCKYCQRKFDPAVAARHIPRCKDIKSRPKPPPKR